MKIKQLISAALSLCLVCGSLPVGAAADADVAPIVNCQFDNELTNMAPTTASGTVTATDGVKVADDGDTNKALKLGGENKETFTVSTNALPTNAIISFDAKKISKEVDFAVAMDSANNVVVKAVKGNLFTSDGRKLGSLYDNKYTNVRIEINKKNLGDIYINDKMILKQWKLPAKAQKTLVFEKTSGEVLIDNILVYEGKDEMDVAPVAYVEGGDADMEYEYFYNADYALVDTENLYDATWASDNTKYRNAIPAPKTNKITLNRLQQREDPNRENGYIIMEKTTASDVHYDFTLLSNHDMGDFFYFTYEGRVRGDKFGAPIRPAYMRDTYNGNPNIEPIRIDSAGNVVTGSGKVVKKLNQGEWLNFLIALDMKETIADVYIDNVLVDSYKFNANFKKPGMLRIWVDTGDDCTATFDKLKFLGKRNPYDPANPDYHPGFFSSDDGIVEYMQGKTAFYGYSENVFANGVKNIRVDKPLVIDHVTYVTAKALSLGYSLSLSVDAASKSASGSDITLTADSKTVSFKGASKEMLLPCVWENDTLYIPAETFAREVLGHCVKNDGNGLVVTAPEKFYLDTYEPVADYLIQAATRSGYRGENAPKPAKALNWFMSFERPSVETIMADFNKTTDSGAAHPRLVATKEDFDRIRANKDSDPVLKGMINQIMNSADGHAASDSPAYAIPDKQRILDQARVLMTKIRYLGFAYQLTGDKKYSDAIWKNIEGVLNYPDWNPSHMIDTGELCFGVALGYDWAYDSFTEEQRAWIYERIKVLGLKPIHDHMHDIVSTRYAWAGANDFIASKSNFNTVINGGCMSAALAFAEMDPDFCFDLISDNIRSIEYTMLVYRPGGIWMESSSYWDYSSSYLSKGIGSLINCTGNHYGIMDAQGAPNTGRWIVSQNSYGGINNFHDAGGGKFTSPFVGWFAKVYDDKPLSAIATSFVTTKQRGAQPEDAIWYVPNNTATADDLDLDLHYEGFDTVGSRSSYSDGTGLYYGTHGGQVTCYHSQYDVCTYVMDMKGVRWATDLGSDDYNVRRDNGGFHKMYRDITEGHNVMLFDKAVPGMDVDGCAVMTRWDSKPKGSLATYDISTVYKTWVNSAHRGFYMGDERTSFTVKDEFNVRKDMPAHWFMHTQADIEIVDGKTAILSSKGQRLRLQVDTNIENFTLTYGDARPLDTSPDIPGQNQNVGYRKVIIEMSLKANRDYYLTVKMSPAGESTSDIKELSIPMSQWQIPDGEYNPRPVLNAVIYANGVVLDNVLTNGKLGITEGQPVPVITAVPEDPSNTVEIIYGENFGDPTVVRIYTADKSYYAEYGVDYVVNKSADISKYKEIKVQGVEVSGTPEEDNHKMNMFDNNFTTRWTSPNQSGSWAIFDLGESKAIDAVSMAFWRGDTRQYFFELFVSDDGENWTPVAKGSNTGTTEGLEVTEINSKGRYIKFLGGGNTNNGHSNIFEFKVLQKQ